MIGLWEVNYIMNAPKPVGELFPKVKPTISFDSYKNSVSGMSGCNNFNGEFTISGKSIKIDEAMALTRKMCPDMAGEQAFLETLKKVNAYSVTDQGKTLNLIMGDLAVMRLERK
ncbi:META domain-containing protein [Flavobacterium sp. TSSA_36]|uniref:META domain-containing protein n=1 Tax=Flavobacterium sp. TSSA_36 TaxID=3447669 RepID=UPI003F37141E